MSILYQSKPGIKSTGMWGGLIAVGVPLAGEIAEMLGASAHPGLQAFGSILGGLLALYGRWTATSTITGVFK